jgi:hypothetical protein
VSSFNERYGVFEGVPTVEQVNEFIDVLNTGRKAAGLPVFVLFEDFKGEDGTALFDFDDCAPGSPYECLSATNFAAPLGYTSGSSHFRILDKELAVHASISAMEAISPDPSWLSESGFSVRVPDAILAVTDPFDNSSRGGWDEDEKSLYRDIREAFVEAGWVEGE